MPELPEVETIARGVNRRVCGDRIAEVWFCRYPQPFKTPATLQARGLTGKRLFKVHRIGKHIVCELTSSEDASPDMQWIVHLGMTGRLLVTTPDAPVAAHTHARLRLESGREIRFVDPRRFGRLELRDISCTEAFRAAGTEPLTIGAEAFKVLFRGRKLAIKAALLNQRLLTGIGNIYADESLFHAGIRPTRKADRLTADELEQLRKALQRVLKAAIKLGGSSVSDYVDAEGVRGFFQLEHCVYQREGQPCRQCETPIRKIVLAGRGTHYCPNCQH